MRLDRLVLHGFKSFADKTVFEFPKQFTAVVGPNGSGKSNVADAIRWVLGEQSMKLLRGKHSHDLIFNGSDRLAKLGMAQVELHLDNRDGMFPLEYQEVVISRKVFRNGESEYRINGAAVRLQDVVMMLAKAKFGQKTYAVIGQGMVTHFLTSTPQERKLFFDEATGVREYQIKRDQAINKLIRTEEHLVQSEALVNEIRPHLHSLERQVKRLERREKIEVQLRETQVSYYGSLWHELDEQHTGLRVQYETQQQQITSVEQQMAKQQQASDVLTSEASRVERYHQLQQQFNQLLEQKSHLIKEQAVLKGKLELEHERQGELSLVWLQRKEDELSQDAAALEQELRVAADQMARDTHECDRQEQQLQSLQTEFRDEEYAILKLREQIERETHSMTIPQIQTALRALFDAQEKFLQQLLRTRSMDEFRTVQHQGKELTKRFAVFMDQLTADERDTVEALRVEMKRKEQSLVKLTTERSNVQHRVNELRVAIESAKAKEGLLRTQLQRLQDQLADIHADIEESADTGTEDRKTAAAQYTQQLDEYEKDIAQLERQQDGVRKEIDRFNQVEEKKKTELVDIQTTLRTLQRKLNTHNQEMSTVEVNLARTETRREDVRDLVQRDVPLEFHVQIFEFHSSVAVSRGDAEKKILSLQKQLEAIGSVDQQTVAEYEETKKRYDFLDEQMTDLHSSIQQLERVVDELDAMIHKQFQRNFKKINDSFQDYFGVLFEGGKARLELLTATEEEQEAAEALEGKVVASESPVAGGAPSADGAAGEGAEGEALPNAEDVVREMIGKKKKKQRMISGIDVIASPPRKKITNITALSGGEKSMVAIALLCAIIANNPSPFVVLDEVEAALDEENSEKLAAIVRELARKTQIIIITHNRVTMRAADTLYGVTIGTEGKSHILSVELSEATELVTEPVRKK